MVVSRKAFVWITMCLFLLQHVSLGKKIRGVPEIDYPTYYVIPKTSFSCSDQLYNPGFYADIETRCQVFHYCYEHRQESFLCPLGTVFNQPILSCDYWYSSNCSKASDFYDVNINKIDDDYESDMFISPLEDQSGAVFDKMAHLYEVDTKTSDISVPVEDSKDFNKKPAVKLQDLTEESFEESHIQSKYKNENMDLNVIPVMPFETIDEKHPEFVKYKIKNSNELNVYEMFENEERDEDEAEENFLFGEDGKLHLSEDSVRSRSDKLEEMSRSDHNTNGDTEVKSFDSLESKIQESTDSELHKRLSGIEEKGEFITKRPPRRKPIFIIQEQEVKPVELPVRIVKSKRQPIKIGIDSTVQPIIPSESIYVSTHSSDIYKEATTTAAKFFDLDAVPNDISGDDSEENFALLNEPNENSAEKKSSDKVLDETLMLAFHENENIEQRKHDNATTDNKYNKSEKNTEIVSILSNSGENEISSELLGSGDGFEDTESISVFGNENPMFFEEPNFVTNSRGDLETLEINPENLAENDFLDYAESTNQNEFGSAADIDMILSTESAEDANEYDGLGDYIYLTPDELQEFQRDSLEEIPGIPDQMPEVDGNEETVYYLVPDSESEYEYQFDHPNEMYPEDVNYNVNENLEVDITNDSVDMENIEARGDSNETMIDVPTNEELEDRFLEASEEQIGNYMTPEISIVTSNTEKNRICKKSQNLCLKNSKDTPETLPDNFPELNEAILDTSQTLLPKNSRRKHKVIYKEDKYEDLTPEDIKFLEIMSDISSPISEVPVETLHQVLDEGADSAESEEPEIFHTEIPFNYELEEEYQEPIQFNEIDSTALDNSLGIGKHNVNEVIEFDSKIPETELNIGKEKLKESSDKIVFPEHETLISKDHGSIVLTDSESKNMNEIPFENIQKLPTKAVQVIPKIPSMIHVSQRDVKKPSKENKLERKPRVYDAPIPLSVNPSSIPDIGIVAQKLSYLPTTFIKLKHSTLKPYFSESYYDRDFESSEFFSRSGYTFKPSKLSKLMAFGKKLLRAKRAKLNILRKFAERYGRDFYDLSSFIT